MPRARNIKPGFFVNDELAELPALARLLFIGLWTLADCDGRLKGKPKQIKAQILPYDECCIEALLFDLDKSGFIQIYTVQGQPVIQVVNFTKHQNPHKNEKAKGSEFAPYEDRDEKEDKKQEDIEVSSKIAINPDKNPTDPAERGKRKEERGKRKEESLEPSYRSKKGRLLTGDQLLWFYVFWRSFDYKSGKAEAADAWLDLKIDAELERDILAGAEREARARPSLLEAGKTPKMAQGWLSGRRWEDEIKHIPAKTQDRSAEERAAFINSLPDGPDDVITGQCERIDD